MFQGKIVLITGGSGSWGNELTTQLLNLGAGEIRIFSRGEAAQVQMQRKFKSFKLTFIIGDVRDEEALTEACRGVDYIFHLAALKHVPICESYPQEAIKTNIEGTSNIIKAAVVNKVAKVIDVSTDKAVVPLNLYGMTKAVGEKLILHADTVNKNTRFSVVRGGNALGSNGSVVPFFIDQIKRFNKVVVTDERMTRYFLSLSEAVGLLLTATKADISGGIFVMKMPAFRIVDIAKVLIRYHGNSNTKIEFSRIRPGEKIHEVLVSSYEAPRTTVYGKNYYLINEVQFKAPMLDFIEYASNTKLSGDREIEKLLKEGNYI